MHIPHAVDSTPRRVICRAEGGLLAVIADPPQYALLRRLNSFLNSKGRMQVEAQVSCVDGPRLARDHLACSAEVACSHVSGLLVQSGWTAGPDGVRRQCAVGL